MQKKSSDTGTNSLFKKDEVKSMTDIELAPTMNAINDKVVNKRSADPFDRLIFEKGLRIKQIMVDKKLNTMLLLLNNAKAIQVSISHFSRLKDASQDELNDWELSGNGVGIRWNQVDEDLSLKALIKESALTSVLHKLEGKNNVEELIVL